MNPKAAVDRIEDTLVGRTIGCLWSVYGSAIFLEFGAHSPGRIRRDGTTGNPPGELTFDIEGRWRIEDVTSIIC